MATPAPVTSEASSSAIDERRAQQLMERALTLAERGDQQSAVLSCRQAISLAPESSQAYSMLGLLLERSGDAVGAIAAYEKVLQFAPDSLLERESLSRLRATVANQRGVHEPLRSGPVRESASTPALPNADKTAAAPGTAAVVNASVLSMPLSTTMPMPGIGSPRANGLGDAPATASSVTSWQKLRQRPSSYFRGAPLAATTALSLLFLLWAQHYSASRSLNQAPPAMAGATVELPDDLPPPVPNPPTANAANPDNRNAGERAPGASSPVPVNPGSTTVPTNPVSSAATRPSAPTRSASAGSAPATTAPAPAASDPATSTPVAADADGGRLTTRPAPAAAPPAQPAGAPSGARAGADDAGGASTRGGPLGPGSTPGRSYVRVAPSGTSPVARPENRAANDERAAGNDAQSGRPAAAIERLTQAIDSGGPDVALRFQQRAQLYLQSGDAGRAISDFQAAISAYNDMLARGDRAAIARSGIAACRRGIQMAQARLQQ